MIYELAQYWSGDGAVNDQQRENFVNNSSRTLAERLVTSSPWVPEVSGFINVFYWKKHFSKEKLVAIITQPNTDYFNPDGSSVYIL